MFCVRFILGSFTVGLAFPRGNPRLLNALVAKMEDVTVVMLLPLYFAYSGLKTQLGTLTGVVPVSLYVGVWRENTSYYTPCVMVEHD